MTGVRIDVRMDKADLRRFRRAMAAKPREIENASRRAIRKTVRFGVGRIARGLAQRNQIPQRVLKTGSGHRRAVRIRTRMPGPGGDSGYLWVGVRPVKAVYIGKPRQLRKGVRVGRHRFDGAFLATMRSGHTGAFKRRGKKRLGIVEQVVPLKGADQDIEALRRELGPRLTRTFAQELNYEINVKGAFAVA